MSDCVIVKLQFGEEVIGELIGEEDNGVILDNACLISYRANASNGYPSLMLTKYCLVSRSFEVFFQEKDICQVFYDPIPTLVQHFERTIPKIRKNYFDHFENGVEYKTKEPSTIEELFEEEGTRSEKEEMIAAIAELFSANTTIQ